MLCDLSDDSLEQKLDLVERELAICSDEQRPAWNRMLQRLLDEQVRRDLERQDADRNAGDSR
jgi:hypothetical protein